jgi:hypothetical protein
VARRTEHAARQLPRCRACHDDHALDSYLDAAHAMMTTPSTVPPPWPPPSPLCPHLHHHPVPLAFSADAGGAPFLGAGAAAGLACLHVVDAYLRGRRSKEGGEEAGRKGGVRSGIEKESGWVPAVR